MYKELYKQEINILGMSNSIYLVSMNENMKTILNRYKMEYQPLLTTTIPRRLYNYIETGVEFRKDVNSYTYKSVKNLNFIMRIKLEMNIRIIKYMLINIRIQHILLE